MVKLFEVKKPFTPMMRRFILDIFRPSAKASSLGKRNRNRNDDQDSSAILSAASPCPPLPASVALQNDDPDSDAIIITALDVIPFCCHADLLSMDRPQLLAVARTLNAKLPHALQIDIRPARTDIFIRNSIELIVGLRRDALPAPKPTRSRSLDANSLLASPATPLANQSRSSMRFSPYPGTPLGMVREEDEEIRDDDRSAGPQRKRRRVTSQGSPCMVEMDSPTPRRIARSQSARVAATAVAPAVPSARVLRSYSQKLPERKPNPHPNVTVTRGRGRARSNSVAPPIRSVIVTSTPNNKRRRITAGSGYRDGMSPDTSATSLSMPTSIPSRQSQEVETPGRTLRRRKMTSVDAAEVTFGIDGMTVAVTGSCSDMDLSEG